MYCIQRSTGALLLLLALGLGTPIAVSAAVFESSLLILSNTVRLAGGASASVGTATFRDETPRALGTVVSHYHDRQEYMGEVVEFFAAQIDDTITTRLLPAEISLEQSGRYTLTAVDELPKGVGFGHFLSVVFEVRDEPVTIELFNAPRPEPESGWPICCDPLDVQLFNAESDSLMALLHGTTASDTRYDDYTEGFQNSSGAPIPIHLDVGTYRLVIDSKGGSHVYLGGLLGIASMYAGLRVVADGGVAVPEPVHLSFSALLLAMLLALRTLHDS